MLAHDGQRHFPASTARAYTTYQHRFSFQDRALYEPLSLTATHGEDGFSLWTAE